MHEAMLWEATDGRVRCLLCPHACAIAPDRVGVCGVRRNVDGVLQATTYGLVSSVAVDPIEKKPVFHYRPGTLALSLGSVGCTMQCLHCQNWQISRARPEDGEFAYLAPEDVPRIARDRGCAGVAFTYNEPVIWIEYVLDVARACHAAGLYTVMVTNGYITPSGLDLVGDVIDVWRVDVKGDDDETYRHLCKVPSVGPVLDMAVRAQEKWEMHVEVVTNIVPGYNDSDEALSGIARWVRSALGSATPWHVTRFHPYLELSHVPATPVDRLESARQIGLDEGLDHVYLGNVAVPGGEDTRCAKCGAVAIARDGFDVVSTDIQGSRCGACGAELHLVVDSREGTPWTGGHRGTGD